MNIVEVCFSLGQMVKVDMPGHSKHGEEGRLIKVQSHKISIEPRGATIDIVEAPLCVVAFSDFIELPFMPRHIVCPTPEDRELRRLIFLGQ